MRAHAAKALGSLGHPGVAEALLPRLGDASFWVRQNVAVTLRALGPRGLALLRQTVELHEDPFARDAARQELRRHELLQADHARTA